MFDFIKNAVFNRNRYKTHSEAVIVSCFFNPQNSPYRLLAFQKWYHSIKHLNHRIVECVIGDSKSQLPDTPYITKIYSDSLLWHKESIINRIVADLPPQFKYVFWVDADVLFTNQDWLVEGVKCLENGAKILQPFEYCVHLERNQLKPRFNMIDAKAAVDVSHQQKIDPKVRRVWRSFCSNVVNQQHDISAPHADSENYDEHGHVGFAWGARRDLLETCPLYDHALVGGADHVIAHAAAGHVPHKCITKSFTDDIDEIIAWSKRFHNAVRGRSMNWPDTKPDYNESGSIGFVQGDLYHLWHGDIASRQYLKRIKEFTLEAKNIKNRDKNGLHTVVKGKDKYVRRYFQQREIEEIDFSDFEDFGYNLAEFVEDMGYALADILVSWSDSEPTYDEPISDPEMVVQDEQVESVEEEQMQDEPIQSGYVVESVDTVQDEYVESVNQNQDESLEVNDELENAIYQENNNIDDSPADATQPENVDGDEGNFS